MIIDIAAAISALRPGAEFTLSDNDFNTLDWLDRQQVAPTKAEVETKLLELQQQAPLKESQRNRATAYTAEADPLFFKAQRGEATIEEWEAKVEEIRTRYPYPVEAKS
jgi:hypothetical protein